MNIQPSTKVIKKMISGLYLGDKEQEINQNMQYIRDIVSSNSPKWCVTSDTFSLTISKPIQRTFSRAELESYEQQINYFLTLKKVNPQLQNIFQKYLTMLKNVRNRWNFCSEEFCCVHDPYFNESQFLVSEEKLIPSELKNYYEEVDDYYFESKDYYTFGNYLLNYGDRTDISNELLILFHTLGKINPDQFLINEFIKEDLLKSYSIDPIKVGKRFVKFLKSKEIIENVLINREDIVQFDTNKSFQKATEFLKLYEENTLLISNVPKPAHTLHLIQPIYLLWQHLTKGCIRDRYCPQENIIFCTENNEFQDLLNNLSNKKEDSFCFIVHPENLKSDDMERLKTFISARRNQKLNKNDEKEDAKEDPKKDKKTNKKKSAKKEKLKIPNVMIITALPASFFSLEINSQLAFDDSFIFKEEEISDFATFNSHWRKEVLNIRNDVFLFTSSQPGLGKTYRINQIIDEGIKQIDLNKDEMYAFDKKKVDKDHFYFDITTEEIPEIIMNTKLIHFSFSSDLFKNNFEIIDQLYRLIQYGFFIYKSGKHVSLYRINNYIQTFLIELPNLKGENLEHFYDFPIAPSNNKKEWKNDTEFKTVNLYNIIKDKYNDVEDKSSFVNGLFHLNLNTTQLQIDDENVKSLVSLVFDNHLEIRTYKDLIEESKSLFFPSQKIEDFSYIDDNRIISKVKKMIEDYSKIINAKYKEDSDMRKIMFLLTIRTVMYVWHFTPETIHSIIVLIPQRLMAYDAFKPNNGWIFVGFYSNYDKVKTREPHKNQKRDNKAKSEKGKKNAKDEENADDGIPLQWDKTNVNISDDICSDADLINKTVKLLTNDVDHILSVNQKDQVDNIFLQTQFFKTILKFLSPIDYEHNATNPLNIATILLTFFSDMHHYPKDHFNRIIDDFCKKDKTIKDHQQDLSSYFEWTEIDTLLANYLKRTEVESNEIKNVNKLILYLKSQLTEYESIWNVMKISFSKTYFGRFIEIIIKIYYRHFTILQGDTGCGKTSVIHLINDIITLAQEDENMRGKVNWKFVPIDFHGNYTQKDFTDKIESVKEKFSFTSDNDKEGESINKKIILFFDEVNTSPAYYYVIDFIQNSSYKIFSYVASINEYIEVDDLTRKLSRVGIVQKINRQLSKIKLFTNPGENITELTDDYDVNQLAYNVKEQQESVNSAIIHTDPQEFDEKEHEYAKYLPDEEKNAIRSIINKILLQWKNNYLIDFEEIIKIFSEIIFKIFKSVRSFLQLRAIFSYRDVHRCLTIFTNIFDYFTKRELNERLEFETKDKNKEQMYKYKMWQNITSISIVISIYISLICRFSHEEIEINNEIRNRLEGHVFNEIIDKNQKTICLYKLIMNYVSEEKDWPSEILPPIKDWEQISILFAYARCSKYLRGIHRSIIPLPSLMLHLLIIKLTVAASFHAIDDKSNSSDFFTCLIVGMPGTSKSKSVEIYKKYYNNKENSSKHSYFITTYLCSRTSDSDSLLAQFMNGAFFLKNDLNNEGNKIKKSIVILEEVGLANYNPSRPLKILHPLCDKGVNITIDNRQEYCKIIPIQLSNYSIDFANMNRGFLVCAGLPSDDEFASSIAFGKVYGAKNFINFLTCDLLYHIARLESKESYKSYDETVRFLIKKYSFEVTKDEQDSKQKYDSLIAKYDDNKEFYNSVLTKLWSLTQSNEKRPSFYPMRPMFNLIKLVTKLKQDSKHFNSVDYETLSCTLNSFIHDKKIVNDIFDPKESEGKPESLLNRYLKSLEFNKAKEEINSVTLFRSFKNDIYNRKALLIRTENYEAYRYFNLLLEQQVSDDILMPMFYFNFVPFKFEDIGNDCQIKFDTLFSNICNNDPEIDIVFCSIGNDPFSDYIIDILNSINSSGDCPTAILKGFPVYLPSFPSNIKFIFIINESDIYNDELKNPVPYPLIDRLDHLFLNKKILRAFSDSLFKNIGCDSEVAKVVLDMKFTKTKIVNKKKKSIDVTNEMKRKYFLNYDKSDFDYLSESLQKDDEKILTDHFENSFIKDFDDLLSILKSEKSKSDKPKKGKNLKKKTKKQESDDSDDDDDDNEEEQSKEEKNGNENKEAKRVIVFTRTPIHEQFLPEDDDEFEIVPNVLSDPLECILDVKKNRSIIIHSDIFNIPDENTLTNALSIVNAVRQKDFLNSQLKLKKYKQLYYIIIFHICENRIPDTFGYTNEIPVVWIESLPKSQQDPPLIQEICRAVFLTTLPDDSPLYMRFYAKSMDEVIDKIDKKNQKKVQDLRSKKGLKVSNNNSYNLGDIINKLLENKNAENISFKTIRKDIIKKINEIKENSEKKQDEKTRISNDIKLHDELDKINLEYRFFSTVSGLADENISASLSIIVKYFAGIPDLKKAKKEKIDEFIANAHKIVTKLNTIIPNINFDTFSSPKKDAEINSTNPELMFYNILKSFISDNNYINSLVRMKKLLEFLPELKVSAIFKYINDNYYYFKSGLPFGANPNTVSSSIEIFDDFFNARGLFDKNARNISSVNDFLNGKTDSGLRRNYFTFNYEIRSFRNYYTMDKPEEIDYPKILHSDCHKSFMNICDANEFPHPCIIYSKFINVKGFSFQDYNKNSEDKKIFMNETIPWLLNFFIYGSFNDFKNEEGKTNYLLNLTNFITIAMENDSANFTLRIGNSGEFKHFLFDLLFTEECKKSPTEKIKEFVFFKNLANEPSLNDLINDKFIGLKSSIEDNGFIRTLFNLEVELHEVDPFSEESFNLIKDKFTELEDIEKVIATYDSWKKNHLEMLSERNLLDTVRSELLQVKSEEEELDFMFGTWFLNSEIPLLTRQVYEICKAIKNDDLPLIQTEFKILQRIINPWSDNDRVTKYFWKWFVDSVTKGSPFANKKFTNLFKDNPLKDIIQNCLPYYICEDKEDPTVTKTVIIAKVKDVKTYFIERLLYSNAVMDIPKKNKDKCKQLFNFFSSIPFIKHTKYLYVLAGFVNDIMRIFRDQINLLYLVLNSLQNCSELKNVSNIQTMFGESEDQKFLMKALEMADKYNKGENAAGKLKSYINRLIEINNNTIICVGPKVPNTVCFRLIENMNLHSNMSLMNTFLPALAHMKLMPEVSAPDTLLNAMTVLTSRSKSSELIPDDFKIMKVPPSIFDFSQDNSWAKEMFVKIEQIKDDFDLFNFPKNDLALSLCQEFINFMKIKENRSSYRAKIWNLIKRKGKVDKMPIDCSKALSALIPLFEEFDSSLQDDHLFFKWENKEELPDPLVGVEHAAYFLQNNKIGDDTIFDFINDNI